MTTQALPDLDQLTDTYDLVGELAGRDDARTFLARRRDDGLDVLVVVAGAVPGDEGNALSHLAADANLLSALRHRSLLPVLEGRWLGGSNDAFALVLQRTNAPTLAELLHRRDEEFDYPRIAAILAETNGVLEWARTQKVVHRRVTPETLYVEPGTDRVQVSFAVAPLPANGVSGPHSDGVTIAALARAMLTRSPADPERETRPLAELRPGLPVALLDETERLLHPDPSAPAVDASGYVARIAMAAALKSAEEHLEASRNAIEIQEREHRAQIEKERREHEAQIAAERKAHDEQIAAERKAHERAMEVARREHEKQVADQARQLQREREQHARDVAEKQREFEKRVAEQQQQFERQVAEQQKTFERQVAEQQKTLERQVADQQKSFERQVAEREKQLQREREEHARQVAQQTKQLQREREEHERQMAEQTRRLQREREQVERELAKQRSQAQRDLEREREQIAREREALAALGMQAEMYAATSELPVANGADLEVGVPRHAEKFLEREVPAEQMALDEDESAADVPPAPEPRYEDLHDEIIDEDEEPAVEPIMPFALASFNVPSVTVPPVPALDFNQARASRTAGQEVPAKPAAWRAWRPRWRKSWNVPAAAAGLVALIGITALALSGGSKRTADVASAREPVSTVVVDSAGGNVYQSIVPLPKIDTDTGVLSARATDWTPPPRRRAAVTTPAPERQVPAEPADAATNGVTPVTPNSGVFQPTAPPRDTSARAPAPARETTPRPARRDTTVRDTVRAPMVPLPFTIPAPAAKRDSAPKPAAKPDTVPKRDSL